MRGLQHLAAHQAGLRAGRCHALAHHGAAQRSDPVDQIETKAPRALNRKEIGEQGAIEHVDSKGAAFDVGPAQRVVARQQIGRADVVAVAARGDCKLADAGGIAQAEIEALCADRWNEVSGFADQCDAVGGETPCRLDGQRPRSPCRGWSASAVRSRR
jgi:hypothetical protein